MGSKHVFGKGIDLINLGDLTSLLEGSFMSQVKNYDVIIMK